MTRVIAFVFYPMKGNTMKGLISAMFVAMVAIGWWGYEQTTLRRLVESKADATAKLLDKQTAALAVERDRREVLERCVIEYTGQLASREATHRSELAVFAKTHDVKPQKTAKSRSAGKEKRTVTVTAYTLSHDECGATFDPALSGSKAIVGRTAAVSPDLSHWLGTSVLIEGFGIRFINDLTSDRYKNRVDILVASKKEAYEIGRKNGIPVQSM